MQSWTSKGSLCLLCTFRPAVLPARRTFATSPVMNRVASKVRTKSKKAAQELEKQVLALDAKNAKNGKINKAPSGVRNIREKLAARDFSAAVTHALGIFRQMMKERKDPGLPRWKRFERTMLNACKVEDKAAGSLRHVRDALLRAFLHKGVRGLTSELDFYMYAEEITSKYSDPNLEQQKKVADLRRPAEWYPHARAVQRTLHLHVGPTNSGKTYHALQRLEACKRGFYAGPLRLLAQEVYSRFHAKGTPCSLITGDDVKIPEGEVPTIVSNTVEMVSLGEQYDVGVIDEIQMIADPHRGWAWTRAVLGARATELHLCGEIRAIPLIRQLAALTGDKLEIHRYKRLNPLKVMDRSLNGDLKNLQKGDCLVSFSRVGIHALKADIEKTTGKRAAIVYGSLPAEIRTQQASLFNDPDNDYDFLVASDAIGMGLNLSCKRIIFETVIKRLPSGLQRLSVPEIKQIAGRAGRYRSAAQQSEDHSEEENVGWVTSLEDIDLPHIREAMETEPPPLTAACIGPLDTVFKNLAAYFPNNVPLEYLIKRMTVVAQIHPLFFLQEVGNQLENAEVVDSVDGLRIADQLTFMAAPLHTRTIMGRDAATAFAKCVAEHSSGSLLDIPVLNLEILEKPVSGSKEYLHELESLHKAVILYLWLSYRCGGVFTDRTLATHVKELVEERMVRALTEFSANKKLRKNASLQREIALQKQLMQEKRLLGEADADSYGNEDESANADPLADQDQLEDDNETTDLSAGEEQPKKKSSQAPAA
ncbi:ATP-dependent RNA helicase SUV3 [Aspergillus heteromorphus CBS 117.55]|uniref:RNA helicase n=1 Tax=Aspergillus heteromorphus CBS 117.55 TaxID=1448321 RepID=A0A317VZS5_9EURO|nr:ATP-dependent RNA helicase SUV3 [Aspergillus heteromorphus CBS 117.55]PWY79265.1 ATP-dependent RNA helicase SUV3 [Aspergillus heteromorphus CBS 117.55]